MKRIITLSLIFVFLISFASCFSSDQTSNKEKNNPLKDSIDKIIYHTVYFETDGGTYINPKQTKILEQPPLTEKEGYLFEGWFFDPTFTRGVGYPLEINNDITLYAKWLKLINTSQCQNSKIKLGTGYDFSASYSITPNGFELERLEELGYKMEIIIEYEVYYKKDYDIPFDIGYAGAPKYEISILNQNLSGNIDSDIKATKNSQIKTFSYKSSIADIRKNKLTLTFSTNNVQNVIYFKNIKITYRCYQ